MGRAHGRHEGRLRRAGAIRIAGIDEVGRGPLAGPVTAAAVILPRRRVPKGLADSKTLTPGRRAALASEIRAVAEVCVAHASVDEIAALNILGAAQLAMCRALAGLGPVCHALVDGDRVPRELGAPATPLVGGDAACLSIAAASIVAKVARDAIMADLALAHPGYGWERNMGYGTVEHRAALTRLGPTPHHRAGFAPVRNILCGSVDASA